MSIIDESRFHLLDMLKHSRELVERRQNRHDRRRVYTPRINWSNWLSTGNQEEEALPASGRQAARRGASDEEADENEENETLIKDKKKGDLERDAGIDEHRARGCLGPSISVEDKCNMDAVPQPESLSLRVRGLLADMLEWAQESEDLQYAIKLTVAVFLVTWPAFIAKWNSWYSLNRGCRYSSRLLASTISMTMNMSKSNLGVQCGRLCSWY